MITPLLIVGLGNPTSQYANTWHNAGFEAVDFFKKKLDKSSEYKLSKKNHCLLATGQLGEQKIYLAKPQTFMNNSGQSIVALINYFKIEATAVYIVHDEIDLPLGKIRISTNSSAGGHNGIKSIISQLGRKDFARFRIGINTQSKVPTEKYVLTKIAKAKRKELDGAIEKTAEALALAVTNGLPKAMNQYN